MQLVFCGSGWPTIVERIRDRLPDEAGIRVRDLDRPVAQDVRDAHVILPSNARIDAAVMDAAPELKLIQQPAAGYEGVDLDAAKSRSLPVCNAPGTNHHSLAEAALLLLLSLARRVPEVRVALREGLVGEPVGHELHGKTLGVIGLGRSGSALARAAEGLGMRVLSVTSQSAEADRDRLLAESDAVSVHVPLTSDTRGLVGADALAKMKRGAWLLNCARGPIVDRAALVAALDSGQLGGAGLDVHWVEPPDADDPLYARPNVVALSHVGGSTEESYARIADVVVTNVRALLAGEPLVHRVV